MVSRDDDYRAEAENLAAQLTARRLLANPSLTSSSQRSTYERMLRELTESQSRLSRQSRPGAESGGNRTPNPQSHRTADRQEMALDHDIHRRTNRQTSPVDESGAVYDLNRFTGRYETRRGLLGIVERDTVPFTNDPAVPRTPFVGPQPAYERFTGRLKEGPDGRSLYDRPPPG